MKPTPLPPTPSDPWLRLAALARSAPPTTVIGSDESAEFSARVVARWLRPPPPSPSSFARPPGWAVLWEAWTLRATAAACALALTALALNFQVLRDMVDPESFSLDPVTELFANF